MIIPESAFTRENEENNIVKTTEEGRGDREVQVNRGTVIGSLVLIGTSFISLVSLAVYTGVL